MSKTKLTIDQALNNQKYRNILMLINRKNSNKPLQFLHLRYALCINHGLNLKIHKNIKEYFCIEEYSNYDIKVFKKKIKNIIDFFRYTTLNFDKIKFNKFQALSNALKRLKNLGLIQSKKKGKKGYKYYYITPKGEYHIIRWIIHWHINRVFPEDMDLARDIDKITDKEKNILKNISNFNSILVSKLYKPFEKE